MSPLLNTVLIDVGDGTTMPADAAEQPAPVAPVAPPPDPTPAPAPPPEPTLAPIGGRVLIDVGDGTVIPVPPPPAVPVAPPPPPPPEPTPPASAPPEPLPREIIPQLGTIYVDLTGPLDPPTLIVEPGTGPPADVPGDGSGGPATLVAESDLPKLPADGRYTHAQLEQIWAIANGLPQFEDVAAAVAQAESGGDPTQINNTGRPNRPGYHKPRAGDQPEYSVGLWQINLLAHPSYSEALMLTPLGNAAAAIAISNDGHNFGAWSTYTSGAYKKFLTGATAPSPPSPPAAVPRSPNAPPGVQSAWGNLIDQYATHAPKARAHVRALSDDLIGVFK